KKKLPEPAVVLVDIAVAPRLPIGQEQAALMHIVKNLLIILIVQESSIGLGQGSNALLEATHGLLGTGLNLLLQILVQLREELMVLTGCPLQALVLDEIAQAVGNLVQLGQSFAIPQSPRCLAKGILEAGLGIQLL